MEKIPTLFKREFLGQKKVKIIDEVTPGFEWVLNGDGIATEKMDGSCCALIDGIFYKRYDAKKGKTPPVGALPCCEPDPITGHWPHWVKVDKGNPEDKWFIEAYNNSAYAYMWGPQKTFEAIGPHFQGNPYNLGKDFIIPHGSKVLDIKDRSFEGIIKYLSKNEIEGIVFWKDGTPQCKIKRSDFGLEWPIKRK